MVAFLKCSLKNYTKLPRFIQEIRKIIKSTITCTFVGDIPRNVKELNFHAKYISFLKAVTASQIESLNAICYNRLGTIPTAGIFTYDRHFRKNCRVFES